MVETALIYWHAVVDLEKNEQCEDVWRRRRKGRKEGADDRCKRASRLGRHMSRCHVRKANFLEII